MPRRPSTAAKNTPASAGPTVPVRPRRGRRAAGDDPATSPGGRPRRASARYLEVRPIIVDNTTSNSVESSTSSSSESGSANRSILSITNTSSADERAGVTTSINSTSSGDVKDSGSSYVTDNDNDEGATAGRVTRYRKSSVIDTPGKAAASARRPARRSAKREVVGSARAHGGAARAPSRLRAATPNTRKVTEVVISTSTSSTSSEAVEEVLQQPLHRAVVRPTSRAGGTAATAVGPRPDGSTRTAKNAVASKHDSPSGDSGNGEGGASAAEDDAARGKVQHKAMAAAAKGSRRGAAAAAGAGATGLAAGVPALADDVPDLQAPKYTPMTKAGGGLLYKDAGAYLPLPEQHVRDWFPAAFPGGSRNMDPDAGRGPDACDEGARQSVLDSSLNAERRIRRRFCSSPKKLRLNIDLVGHGSRHPRYDRLRGPHEATVKTSRGLEPFNLILNQEVRQALEGCRLLGYGGCPSTQEGRHSLRRPRDDAGVKLFVQLPSECEDKDEEEEEEEGGKQGSKLKRAREVEDVDNDPTEEEEEEEERTEASHGAKRPKVTGAVQPKQHHEAALAPQPRRPVGRPRKHCSREEIKGGTAVRSESPVKRPTRSVDRHDVEVGVKPMVPPKPPRGRRRKNPETEATPLPLAPCKAAVPAGAANPAAPVQVVGVNGADGECQILRQAAAVPEAAAVTHSAVAQQPPAATTSAGGQQQQQEQLKQEQQQQQKPKRQKQERNHQQQKQRVVSPDCQAVQRRPSRAAGSAPTRQGWRSCGSFHLYGRSATVNGAAATDEAAGSKGDGGGDHRRPSPAVPMPGLVVLAIKEEPDAGCRTGFVEASDQPGVVASVPAAAEAEKMGPGGGGRGYQSPARGDRAEPTDMEEGALRSGGHQPGTGPQVPATALAQAQAATGVERVQATAVGTDSFADALLLPGAVGSGAAANEPRATSRIGAEGDKKGNPVIASGGDGGHASADDDGEVAIAEIRAEVVAHLASAGRLSQVLHSAMQRSLYPGDQLPAPLATLVRRLADVRHVLERSLEVTSGNECDRRGGGGAGGSPWPAAAWLQRRKVAVDADAASAGGNEEVEEEEEEPTPEAVAAAACRILVGQRLYTAKLLAEWYRSLVQMAVGIGNYRRSSGAAAIGDAEVATKEGPADGAGDEEVARRRRMMEGNAARMLVSVKLMQRALLRADAEAKACKGLWAADR